MKTSDRNLRQALDDLREARKVLKVIQRIANNTKLDDVMVICRAMGTIAAEASGGLIMSGRGDELKEAR